MIDLSGNTITASNETLLRQAPMTAHDYLMHAIHDIDELLGKGYAKAHPELMGAYMQTAAMDLGAAVIARALDGVGEAIQAANVLYETACAAAATDPDWIERKPLQSVAARARRSPPK
jgi:hypothetical protein